MASEAEDKRWSLVDEISKLFKASLGRCFPELEQEAEVFRSTKKEHGDFTCDYVLIDHGPILRNNFELRDAHPHIKRPRDVGKAIKKNLPDSAIDMIEGRPCVFDVGFVTFSLSPKWMAESIHKMLKNGIDTWAPKLPVERTSVLFKVVATMTLLLEGAQDVLDSRLGILKKWYGFKEENADWIVCVAPVRQQEYIEMCITEVAVGSGWYKLLGLIELCNIEPKELAISWGPPEDANVAWVQMLLVVRMTCVLMVSGNHNLVCILQKTLDWPNCTFTSWEILFVCLLITRAKIHRITHGYRKDIDELMKALEVIVEINEQSERALELHLLEFTEVKPVAESTLLLYVATRVVMDRCFILLGLMPVLASIIPPMNKNLGSKCGLVKAKGEDGYTEMYYMLIKDAVDARVEIRDRATRALLFRAAEIALEELGEKIPLRKAVMAVPKGAPLKILAHLYDIESDEVILDGICELSSLTEGRSKGATGRVCDVFESESRVVNNADYCCHHL
ncbi:arginine--tRNA ligase, chloroplastic/mitochondrial [Tanacetum coccineum]